MRVVLSTGVVRKMQRVQLALSQGLDGTVKTIYSPLPLLIEHHFFFESFIVKTSRIVTSNRPLMGLVAFVCAGAIKPMGCSFGGCMSALHLGQPAGHQQLDRAEDQMHPGEGSA
jgi:hypothetical protein